MENTPQGFLIGQNQTLVCLGDSITEAKTGYCGMIAALIAAQYPQRNIRVINAGIGGHKITDMLARLDKDVLAHKPDWVTLSVGINDVWHGLTGWGSGGVELDAYRAGVENLVERVRAANAQIVLVPPTVIEEDPQSVGNQKLASYKAALHEIARAKNILIAPTDTMMDAALTLLDRKIYGGEPGKTLTTDGVHMRPPGDAIMAFAVLKTLGFGA